MGDIVLSGATSGACTLHPTDIAGTTVLTLPSVSGTVIAKDASNIIAVSGVQFPATQSASTDANTLDDYEEGTWTPVVTAQSGSGYTTVSYAANYTKIGRLVTINFNIQVTAAGTASGIMTVSGLPFASVLPNAIVYESQQPLYYGATGGTTTSMEIRTLSGGGVSWAYARQYLTTFTYQV